MFGGFSFDKGSFRVCLFPLELLFWSVLISLLINSLDMCFVSDFFFSRLAKYLVFCSLFSIMFASDLNIKPFSSRSIMDSYSFFHLLQFISYLF